MRIKSVRVYSLDAPVPVYDVSVLGTENFLLAAGVFVHNSKDLIDSVCGAYTNMLERKSTWTAAAVDDMNHEADNRATFDGRFDEPRRN